MVFEKRVRELDAPNLGLKLKLCLEGPVPKGKHANASRQKRLQLLRKLLSCLSESNTLLKDLAVVDARPRYTFGLLRFQFVNVEGLLGQTARVFSVEYSPVNLAHAFCKIQRRLNGERLLVSPARGEHLQ